MNQLYTTGFVSEKTYIDIFLHWKKMMQWAKITTLFFWLDWTPCHVFPPYCAVLLDYRSSKLLSLTSAVAVRPLSWKWCSGNGRLIGSERLRSSGGGFSLRAEQGNGISLEWSRALMEVLSGLGEKPLLLRREAEDLSRRLTLCFYWSDASHHFRLVCLENLPFLRTQRHLFIEFTFDVPKFLPACD